MIFSQSQIPNAVNIPFNWVADYFDGTYLSEYDFYSNTPNNFYSINQNNTIRFGLIGQNMKFYFENTDGSFYLNGRRTDIAYEVDGVKHFLTNNANRKDFITYKQAHTEFNQRSGIQRSNIESINFGYKTTYKVNGAELFFQPVVTLPFNGSAAIEIKISSDEDMNGDIVFIKKGEEVERFHAPLSAHISGQINWTIK